LNRFRFDVNSIRLAVPISGQSGDETNRFRYGFAVPTKREQPPTAFAVATTREIKARIEELGVTNAAVARKTGLSQNYLNERLREEKSFTLSDIEHLADYFKVSPAELMAAAELRIAVDVGAGSDTSLVDEIPVLTAGELAKRDLAKAAFTAPDQEDDDAHDARPRA
jgi:transcriptional regulator with XRE-family HTH domain